MKKIISVILSVTLLLSVFAGMSMTANAAVRDGTTGDLTWTLDTNTGEFRLSGTGRGDNYANSALNRAPWYLYRTQIKSVVVESGVIQIGAYSFYNCSNLTSVTMADTVDTIGDCCFRSCTSLTGIKLPANCSWYYKELFLDCTALKWAYMPTNNLTNDYSGKLPDGTFSGCTALEEVYIGSGHTALDTKAFYNCSSLKCIVWDSGTISAVGTNALYNVPSGCTFVDDSASMSAWTAGNGYAYSGVSGICSDNTYSSSNLTYNLDTSNMTLYFSGSGDMNSTPWSLYHYLICDISFADVDNTYSVCANAFTDGKCLNRIFFNSTNVGELHIYPYAFSNCDASTFWINLPGNVKYIDEYAFYGTGFNYVTCESPDITIGTEAFGDATGSFAQFLGIADSGFYDFVKAGQAKGYDWHYYCLNDNHIYNVTTVAPTCTEQGYNIYECPYCDVDTSYGDYTDALGHDYVYTSTDGTVLVYSCGRCSRSGIELDSVAVSSMFADAISHDNDNPPYNQSNYNSAVDVYRDGYINARDFLIIDGAINNVDVTNKLTVLDESTTYQTIEGFGASAAWWAQSVGNWENIDEITELLYSKENGIGLSIYRYNLGAGSVGDSELYEVGKRTECFLQSDGTYDWTADAGAQKALASAQKANSDLKVTLFCNSAPVSMTKNGHAFCDPVNSDGSYNSNMEESNYQAFADYVVTCAEHFIDEGYNVTSLSPINEPEWSWAAWYNDDGSRSMNQEGCNWTVAEARNFYNNYMIPTIQRSSKLNGLVDVSVWESGQMNHTEFWSDFMNYMFSSSTSILPSYNYGDNNENIRNYCDSIDTHSYWASQSDREAVASQLQNSNYASIEKVRCTEYCQMTNDTNSGVYDLIQQEGTTNGLTMPYGLALADIMYQDLTILNAVEWDWWVACAYGVYPDALIYVNTDDHSDIQTAKRLWVMGNYSKFIDEGAKRIAVSTQSGITSDIKQSAYLNPDGSVAIVYINSGDATQYTSFDNASYSSFVSYVTDETHDLSKYQSGIVGSKAVAIPAKSVTTVVLDK